MQVCNGHCIHIYLAKVIQTNDVPHIFAFFPRDKIRDNAINGPAVQVAAHTPKIVLL